MALGNTYCSIFGTLTTYSLSTSWRFNSPSRSRHGRWSGSRLRAAFCWTLVCSSPVACATYSRSFPFVNTSLQREPFACTEARMLGLVRTDCSSSNTASYRCTECGTLELE
ncbi:hypothetical protein V7S43_010348 [Phytophthora oleae]|uniref:Secreted protein n=1 Tax=Phytophthora oleae TaxID=2107226 RepID=A0ABD3FCV3_9STRA